MNKTDVLWVGVSLDPSDNPRIPRSRISDAHDHIVSAVTQPAIYRSRVLHQHPNGAQFDGYDFGPDMPLVIDLFDALGFRIGFGVWADDIESGKAMMPKVTDWLRRMGVNLPVTVWWWSPSSVPSFTVRVADERLINGRR